MEDAKYGPDGRASNFPLGMRALTAGDELLDHVGARVDDVDGKRLGTVHAVLVTRQDGHRRFLLVRDRSGHQRAVPVEGALAGGGRVWVPHPKAVVDRGPQLAAHGAVGARTERELCALFGVPHGPVARTAPWERRATLARAFRDPDDPAAVAWTPGPRANGERRSGIDRRTGQLATGLHHPAVPPPPPPPVQDVPRLPSGLPDRRRTAGRRPTDR